MITSYHRPSVVLIVVDGLRQTDVPSMSFLARLARAGVSYEQARSVVPSLTRPAASSLATGATPFATGITGNRIRTGGHPVNTASPDDLALLRSLRGNRLLPVPTLGEYLVAHGRTLVAVGTGSNGCTLLLNPGAVDGYGGVIGAHPFRDDAFYAQPEAVRTRLAGSAPATAGGPFPELDWAADIIGDYVLPELKPEVLLLWSGELDDVQHEHGVDCPASDAALSEIDRRLSRLVGRIREVAPETDVIVTADHGFSNATHAVDVADVRLLLPVHLVDSVHLIDNNGALLVYADRPLRAADSEAVLDALMSAEWAGPVFADSDAPGVLPLACLGSGRKADDLLAYVSLASHDQLGALRVGHSIQAGSAVCAAGHGSTSSADMRIPLILNGPSFRTAQESPHPADHLDIPATICQLLGVPVPPSMSGRVLTEAMSLAGADKVSELTAEDRQIRAERDTTDVTTAHFKEFAGRQYFLFADRHRT